MSTRAELTTTSLQSRRPYDSVDAFSNRCDERLDDEAGDGSKKSNWKWAFDELSTMVSRAKGTATEEVVSFVVDNLCGTKVIFVVGKTGSGKTSILSELTSLSALTSGTTLRADICIKAYRVCPSIIDDEQYLFINTAGFGDLDRNDIETFRYSVSSLIAFGSFVQVVGVLFVTGNPGTRLDQQDARTLRWLQCFCGPDFLRNVTIITSFWDTYNAASFRQAYARMQSLYEDDNIAQILFPVSLERWYHGAQFYHHGVTDGHLTPDSFPGLPLEECLRERREELRNLIRRRYAQERYKPVKLQFMKEVERNVSFLETEAGKVLRGPAVGVTINIVQGKCIIEAATNMAHPQPLNFEETPNIDTASWSHTILEWFDIVSQAARAFRDTHTSTACEEAAGTGGGLRSLWDNVRSWWNGSPDTA